MNKTYKNQRETIMDLSDYLNKEVNVEFNGGRRVKGILKSFDNINNLILDNVIEYLPNETGSGSSDQSRQLGIVFARGPEIASIIPGEMKAISPPFPLNDK